MRSLDEILQAPVHGNHHEDRDLWSEIDTLMLDDAVPIAAKQQLLAKLNEITGEDDSCTAQDVDDYVRFLRTGDWTQEV